MQNRCNKPPNSVNVDDTVNESIISNTNNDTGTPKHQNGEVTVIILQRRYNSDKTELKLNQGFPFLKEFIEFENK